MAIFIRVAFVVAVLAVAAVPVSCGEDGSSGGSDSGADTDTDSDTEVALAHSPMTDCDGGKYDPDNGLCWQNPPATSEMDWAAAIAYCDGLDAEGHTDWRLPTISELRSLFRRGTDSECYPIEWDIDWTSAPTSYCGVYDGCLENGCWDTDKCSPSACAVFEGPGTEGCYRDVALTGSCYWYWSSSSYASNGFYAWHVFFNHGVVSFHREKTQPIPVRCVRDGQ